MMMFQPNGSLNTEHVRLTLSPLTCVPILVHALPVFNSFHFLNSTLNVPRLDAANTPTAVTSATADLTLFLTLSVLRNTSFAESVLRQGVWRDGLELAEDPDGKTFGIFGMGAIGKSVARKVGMLGMRVVYFNRRRLGEEGRFGHLTSY